MEAIWSEPTTIRSYDVGFDGRLKLHVLFQYFQEAAANHATHLGVGYDALQELGVFWALSRVKVEIESLPVWRDPITMTTWPKGVEKLFALRDIRMTDRNGAVMARGTSCWLLVDIAKMRPRRIESLERSFPLNDGEHALRESLGKIAVPAGMEQRYTRKVMSSDCDVNNHVNNTEYVRWIVDCIGTAERAVPSIRSLQINFLEEARKGDAVVFSMGRDAAHPAVLVVEGINEATRATVVQSRIVTSA